MEKHELHIDKEKEALEKRIRIGRKLHEARVSKGESLAVVCNTLRVSKNYLSEIERGLKVPSDQLIQDIANYYNMDSFELFQSFGKIPSCAVSELQKFDNLQKTLSEIHANKKLTDDQKQELYDELHRLYMDILNNNW